MTNYLGLDYGSKKIGVAFKLGQDPIVPTDLIIENSSKKIIQKIIIICQEKDINQIVIGLPLNLKGEKGQQAKDTEDFCQQLQKKINLPIVLTDERFTSKIYSGAKNIDSFSAADILDNFLSHQQNK
ncbi:MAG: Holliday junction resolvase RuvX [Patescibacteria group bacterium]